MNKKSVACRNKLRDKCWMLQFSMSLKGIFFTSHVLSFFTFMDPKFKPLRAKKTLPFGKHSKTNTVHLRVGGKKSPDKNQFRTVYTVAW